MNNTNLCTNSKKKIFFNYSYHFSPPHVKTASFTQAIRKNAARGLKPSLAKIIQSAHVSHALSLRR